jgi:small subunit ribosomal protein S3Ae
MAIGKNKRLTKSKKGLKKKVGDPFLKKEWYDVKAPSMFAARSAGKTLVSKTQGTKISTEQLLGRICEVNLGDLNMNADQGFRKIKLEILDTQGKNCLTDFYGMDMTRDKLCSLIRKWQTLIEAQTEVKTTDGYVLRLFAIAFTQRQANSTSSNCYAQTSQIKKIRAKMVEIMQNEASKLTLRELVKRFVAESIGAEIQKQCSTIYPLKDVFIRKVKTIKKPKFDLTKLMELHTVDADTGVALSRNVVPEAEAAKNPLSA